MEHMVQPTATATDRNIKRDGRLVLLLTKPFCKWDLPERIEIRSDRPTLACGNHRSLLDVFGAAAFCAAADVSCRFLVNARYFDNPLIGRWLRRIGCIPLNGKTKEDAFADARASLERGELIGIMPEGKLIGPDERVDAQVGQGRPGASELASFAGAYLRPIVFHNTDKVWAKNGWPIPRFWRRPTVTMTLGALHVEPSDDPQGDVDTVMHQLSWMMSELDDGRAVESGIGPDGGTLPS